METTSPVPPGSRSVDRPPYRPSPRTSAVINKCVDNTLKWGLIEKRPSPWGSACTVVAKRTAVAGSVFVTATPSTATSSVKPGLCPASSPAWMLSAKPYSSLSPTSRVLSVSCLWWRSTSTVPRSSPVPASTVLYFYECRLERLLRRGFSTCYVFGSWSPWSWVWCSLLHG